MPFGQSCMCLDPMLIVFSFLRNQWLFFIHTWIWKILVILQNKSGQKLLLFLTLSITNPTQNHFSFLFYGYHYPMLCYAMLFCDCSLYFFALKRILSLYKCQLPWSKKEGYRGPVLFIHISNYCVATQSKNGGRWKTLSAAFLPFTKILTHSLKTTSPLPRHSELFNNNSDTVLETQFSTPWAVCRATSAWGCCCSFVRWSHVWLIRLARERNVTVE